MKIWTIVCVLLFNIHCDLFSAAPVRKKRKREHEIKNEEQPITLGQILEANMLNADVWHEKRLHILNLIENGSNPNTCIEILSSDINCTPLIIVACMHDDMEVIEALVRAGAKVDSYDRHHMTSLHHIKSLAVANYLLRCDVDPTFLSYAGESPIHALAKIDTDNALLRCIAQASRERNKNALNLQNSDGNTPLHRLLINAQGSKETLTAKWHETVLLPKIAILVLEGAQLGIPNQAQQTPLGLLVNELGVSPTSLDWDHQLMKDMADTAVAESPQEKLYWKRLNSLKQSLSEHLPNNLSSLVIDYLSYY